MSGDTSPERPIGTTVPEPHRPLLVTHSGTFHLDDAFAYAVLRLALGLGAAGGDHALARTRDEAVISGADVVWDVGAVYDAAAHRFDHHQRGAPVRDDRLPYSAAGWSGGTTAKRQFGRCWNSRARTISPRRSRPGSTGRWCAASTGSTTGWARPVTRSASPRWWKT